MKKLLSTKGIVDVFVVLIILGLIALPGVGLGAYRGIQYYQAKQLVTQADSLARVEKYDQAIEKYALAEVKWVAESLKNELGEKLQQVQKLKEEKESYEKGIEYLDDEKWEKAKEALGRVTGESKFFKEAQAKLKLIKEKIEEGLMETEEEVKAPINYQPVTPTTSPTPIPTFPFFKQNNTNPNNNYFIFLPKTHTSPETSSSCQIYPPGSYDGSVGGAPYWKYRCKDSDWMIEAWMKHG